MIEVMESMSVLPERGIYVDNPFEIQFAKELIDRNILFIRPPRTEHIFYHFFKDHIPGFILLDKEKRKFATICEVFKYSKNDRRKTSQKYWQIMNKKKGIIIQFMINTIFYIGMLEMGTNYQISINQN
jgi:hypothetical protein